MKRKFFKPAAGLQLPRPGGAGADVELRLPPPDRLLLPVGPADAPPAGLAPGTPVQVGSRLGQPAAGGWPAVYSGVSGRVMGLQRLALGGRQLAAALIESDGRGTPDPALRPPRVQDASSFLAAVAASGLCGPGGAGLAALAAGAAPMPQLLVINGIEREPGFADRETEMLKAPQEVISGALAIRRWLKLPRVVVAVSRSAPEAMDLMFRLTEGDRRLSVLPVPDRYPLGHPRLLAERCTGRRAAPGRGPLSLGCLVVGAGEAAFIARYLRTGMPMVERRLTVAGPGLDRPWQLWAPLGAPLGRLLQLGRAAAAVAADTENRAPPTNGAPAAGTAATAGGAAAGPGGGAEAKTAAPAAPLPPPLAGGCRLLAGGPMAGRLVEDLDQPLTAGPAGLWVLPAAALKLPAAGPCIHCGRCVRACPVGLTPYWAVRPGGSRPPDWQRQLARGCIGCGCCSYVCPAALPLARLIRAGAERKEAGGPQGPQGRERPPAAAAAAGPAGERG